MTGISLFETLDSRDVDQQQVEEIKKILAEREGSSEQ